MSKSHEAKERREIRAVRESVFNRVRMGYAVIESTRMAEWKQLLGDALGMQASDLPGGALAARMDDHECRILVEQGASEDLKALGLELADEQALSIVLKRVLERGIPVKEGTQQAARLRGVDRFWHFTGPKGMEIELYDRPKILQTPPDMATSGFVTGEKGFGHMAITTCRPDAMKKFWSEIFDIRHTDDVHYTIDGVPLRFEFTRFNERHHSLAFAYTPKIKLDPIRTRIQHLEVQAATLDDLSAAHDRCRSLGLDIAMAVGQHANDKAVSFYVTTPSGFDIEYGWNPLVVDEANWHPRVWDRISNWGHWPESATMSLRLVRLGHAVASLFRKEFAPAGF